MMGRYGVRPGLVEALLILALALLAAPLRGWLAQRFHRLFEREAALYKEIVSRIGAYAGQRSEEHTSELQSQFHLVCRLLLEKKKKNIHLCVRLLGFFHSTYL